MKTQITLAAAYIRVSTDDQTEFSPDAQLRAVKKYCAQQGFTLLEEYIYRESNSAKRAETRPQFMKMISDAKHKPKPFDVILVHRFDRFARNREDSVVYKSLLRREYGIRVVSVTENMGDDKFSVILESMLEAMAEYYSLNLADEVKKGMTEKALRGELQTPAPFGYVVNNGALVPDESRSETVRTIFELYVHSDLSSGEIAKILNDSGDTTIRGNPFEKRSVDYILRNPIYTGKIRWSPSRKANYLASQPEGTIIVDGAHQAIIDDVTFALAAGKIAGSGRKARAVYSHVLSGILKCMRCGGNMYWCGKIFRCGNYLNKKCAFSQGVSARKIEKLIFENMPERMRNANISEIAKAVYYDKERESVKIIFI